MNFPLNLNYDEKFVGKMGPRQLNSFTVPVHSICLPLRLCKGTVTGVRKLVGIPTGHISAWCNGALGNRNLYLNQPVTKAWCQPIGGHISYTTDSPIAIRLGLFSSLSGCNVHCVMGINGPVGPWLPSKTPNRSNTEINYVIIPLIPMKAHSYVILNHC